MLFSIFPIGTFKTYAGKTIGGLTSAQAIAGLRSELSLIESISIDDEERSWNILYAPLEQYSYKNYLPKTILLLCGLRNGSNTITAAHSGLPAHSDSVTVNVETLKDKLYLFQFTPFAKTEISYKDGQDKKHTVYSNNDGSLALFEPNGIASDLRAAAVSNGVSYRGTISQLVIKSGEGSGVQGELYPLNTIELRRAATAQVQLLRPDGAVSGAIGLPIMLRLEGWVSTEIRYSFDDGQWKVLTTGGGFTAGAQLEFEKVLRCSAYGIPPTASFKVRGGATVDFQTAIRYAEQLGLEWNEDTVNAVNDYLTALRINAYFEFFGGLGYDQGFTAKIGVLKEESIAFSKSGTQVILRYSNTVSDNNTADGECN